ncbi:MAG: nucleotide disphospho-sugar-binding domain-containing protein [Actinomycetota bacterium]
MARVKVVCASIWGPGHAHPMLAVARALAARGHEVTFSSSSSHEGDAARAGCAFVQMPESAGSPQTALQPFADAHAMAVVFEPLLRRLKPDLVVNDLLTLGPGVAAEMCGIPYATLSIHSLAVPSRELPPFGWGYPPSRDPIRRRRDEWLKRLNIRDLERARASFNEVRVKLGLAPTDRIVAHTAADLVLVATLPSLEIPRADWPENAVVVGPCLWDAPGEPVMPPPGEGPLVLVATSTAHDEGKALHAAVEAVRKLGVRAIITTGRAQIPANLPSHIVAVEFASHDEVIPQCDAVLCNGGHGIVARSLSLGVPVLVVPGHGDQRENGYRVERAGAGLRVMGHSSRKIARALDRILREPRFRTAARRLQVEAAEYDGPARAADLLEELFARTAAPA